MHRSFSTPARVYEPGIGDAVADRTINRKKPDGTIESWADVALRVARGNVALNPSDAPFEFDPLHHHLRQASLLMSGRHLQHGDETQPTRPQEVFTNCSTAASTFLTFYLLLNGSGVGRSYDDDMMLVDYRNLPHVICAIDSEHRDVVDGRIKAPSPEEVYEANTNGTEIEHFMVPDSREGWAKAIERMEVLAFEGIHRNKILLLDFSDVRPHGSPIGGMQNRPASGPGPLMEAIKNIATLRNKGYAPWLSAMWADHYVAECVLVGGARRAARMAVKSWRDFSVLEFIRVKQGGELWSANNSVAVDAEFWGRVREVHAVLEAGGSLTVFPREHLRAYEIFEAICQHSYHDGTGEPGIINVDKLAWNDEGIEVLFDGDFAESSRYKLDAGAIALNAAIARVWAGKTYKAICNPCGEIVLGSLGGYCVIADVVPHHTQNDDDAENAFRTAVRALMRVNLMDSLYHKEVKRTNRIGVGFTGIHEYAWTRFGLGWKDLVDEQRSLPFWKMLARFRRAIDQEAHSYARKLGVNVPHTLATVKPAGTTSKLFGLTEGAHLPSMREYLRWVQFRNDDPLIAQYRAKGYPTVQLKTYSGTTIVGFPTQPLICRLNMGDKLVTAGEATPEEQYRWLRLLEKWWIRGVTEQGAYMLPDRGNQVSYTLKYQYDAVSYPEFERALLEGQATVRCCSVMPQVDSSAYEYQPEEALTKHEFEELAAAIRDEAPHQDVGMEHLDCSAGACPVDFREQRVA
jgi:hypothetical protein